MLVVNGIHLLENLRLDELAARRAHEFALIVEPLNLAIQIVVRPREGAGGRFTG
jgi:hypothetical protein